MTYCELTKKVDNALLTFYKRRERMSDVTVLLIIIGVWVLLQAVILPKLGVST
jgi:hypothetical protein